MSSVSEKWKCIGTISSLYIPMRCTGCSIMSSATTAWIQWPWWSSSEVTIHIPVRLSGWLATGRNHLTRAHWYFFSLYANENRRQTLATKRPFSPSHSSPPFSIKTVSFCAGSPCHNAIQQTMSWCIPSIPDWSITQCAISCCCWVINLQIAIELWALG